MSNLLSCASPWNDSNNAAKKRMPSIRRTKKNSADLVNSVSHLEESEDKNDNIAELQKTQEEREMKINHLISSMAQIDDDATGLSDFQPLEHPLLQKIGQSQKPKEGDAEINYLPNAMQAPPPRIEQTIGDFVSNNDEKSEKMYKTNPYSNYRRIYEPSKMMPPNNYYEKMGLGTQDNKLMEKINYMIHMLEQQQNEKTSNITEEFILYMFLGIFIIFIVDSFSRTSLKYVR